MKKYDIKINFVDFQDKKIIIGWSAKNIGFGQLTISFDKRINQEFLVETECMGKDFYEQVIEETKKYIFKNSLIIE